MKDKILKLVLGLLIAATVIIFVYRYTNRPVSLDSGYRLVMGTQSHIVIIAKNEESARGAVDVAYGRIEQIEDMMSFHREDSALNEVNRWASKRAVRVNEELFDLIKSAGDYWQISNGAFDVTIGSVVELWQNASLEGRRPTNEELAAAKSKVGFDKLVLDEANRTVRFKREGMKLDLGGIAKGYAVDEAVEALKEYGAVAGLVDIGGEIRCFGNPPGEKYYTVGLQDPAADDNIMMLLELKDKAVATSGNYRRFVFIDGKRYSHIMDPAAAGSSKGLDSVSIISDSAMTADSLATAVSVLGTREGLELIENLSGTEAIIIPSGNSQEVIKTSGAGAYIVPKL